MKLRCLLPALIWLCALATPAQTFTDDLGTKRTNLIYQVRALGPLAPTNWLASGYTWVPNQWVTLPDVTYIPMGNYAFYTSTYISFVEETYFIYRNTGRFAASDPLVSNPLTRMDHFGLRMTDPYNYGNDALSFAGGTYNIAGLQYLSLSAIVGVNGQNQLLGWTLAPGNQVVTGSYYDFDVLQNPERPVFRAVDFWFGYWPNFPQDAALPQPQNSLSQNAGAFLVTPIYTWFTNRVWVKEGVYRPGFTLQPGYSTPRLYTFMEQYAGTLYQTEFSSGDVPRNYSAVNWNGQFKINTNTARQTGLVDSGYYLRTSEPGKAILTTRPLEDGSYGELPIYTLAMFVDKNRDGTLDTNDVTTSASPQVFWVNNDYDRAIYEEKNLWDELDLPAATAVTNDAQYVEAFQQIPSRRDLEDYDRLHLRGLKELCRDLPTGHTVTLAWKTVQWGDPAIYLFKSVETNGGTRYLTDLFVAEDQMAPTLPHDTGPRNDPKPLVAGRVRVGNPLVLHNSSYRCTNEFFIYCGTSRGAGELAVTVTRGTTVICETSVFLELRDVKELYERWTLGEAGVLGMMPTTNATLFSGGLPGGVSATAFLNDSTNQPYILYVHGWNMSPDDKDFFAETAFKRLYWQGYTNRFGALRWPSAYNFGDDLLSYPGPAFTPEHFNRSENYAWRAGEGTRQFLVNLNQRYPGKIHVMAHSMGNVVVGEALALNAQKYGGGQIVNTYVASQAAVSLHAYNGTNSDPSFQLSFQYVHPKLQVGGYGPSDWDSGTPNVHRDWLATNRVSCVARVNFYNLHDYALQMDTWGFNQLFKPSGQQGGSYRYVGARTKPWPLVGWFGGARPSPVTAFLIPSPARLGLTSPAFRSMPGYFIFENPGIENRKLDWEYRLNDMYEVLAFASESRTAPVGATLDTSVMERRLSLQTVWPTDIEPDANNGNHGRHKWHSGQFRMNNAMQKDYWRALLDIRGFNILQ